MSNIPHHVVELILLHLPVKSLLKFSCVSKSWNTTISSHYFSKTQLECSKKTSSLQHTRILLTDYTNHKLKLVSLHSLLNETTSSTIDIDYVFPLKRGITWVGSCNGLVCLAWDQINVILWNPCTGKLKKLPDFGFDLQKDVFCDYGFGYDKSHDDYKVVGFDKSIGYRVERQPVIKIYSLKLDRWKRIKNYEYRSKPGWVTAFANGKLHWQVEPKLSSISDPESDFLHTWPWSIAYLDMKTEEHGILKRPDYVEGGFRSNLAESGGFLYVYCQHKDRGQVWKIEGYGVGKEIWTKIVIIPHVGSINARYFRRLLYVGNNGDIMFTSHKKLPIVVYHKDCSVSYPGITTYQVFLAGPYLESLIPPLLS